MKHFSRAAKLAALALSFLALFLFFQEFLFAYQDLNTHRLSSFYSEEENSLDAVFIGASEVFTGFAPGYAYDRFGFTSYMFAMESNQGSLYKAQLKELLANQSPQVIYVDVFGFLRSVETSLYEEARLRIFTESMPMSANKLETIFSHPYEDKLSCLFPIMKYHGDMTIARSRIALPVKRLLSGGGQDELKGVSTLTAVYPGPGDPGSKEESAFSIAPKCEELLRDFLAYCQSHVSGQVVFVNFPRHLQNEENHSLLSCVRMTESIITEYGFPFIDLQTRMEEIGIDVTRDFYNEHHVNVRGQKKITEFFGALTTQTLGVVPMAQSEKNARRWEEAAENTQQYFALAEQALDSGSEIWLDELCDEWLFRNR
ncbi:MAG: hypothetical protein IKV90_08245 [Clostridia bacterium]|nr:hypothetical protein [Clostridia bacterium]